MTVVKSTVLVSGSLAFDDVFIYDGEIRRHLPRSPNAALYVNLRARGPFRRFGGCGGNVAYTLALLGVTTTLSAWVGKDGGPYLDRLAERGIGLSNVRKLTDRDTPTCVLMVDGRGDQILFFGDQGRDLDLPEPNLTGIPLAVITAGVPQNMLRLLKHCRDRGVPVVLDPGKIIMDVNPEELLQALSGADSLVLNEYERELLIQRSGVPWEHILSAVDTAVVTSGQGPIRVECIGETLRIEPVRNVKIADPNGAGDAFLAGYAFGRYRGLTASWCARLGAVSASFALEALGTQSHAFTRGTFEDRLARGYGRPPH